MAIDARKHTAPAGGESPRRQSINDLSLSINDWVPVANLTERAQVLTALGSTAARPLTVYRADADVFERHNGTSWMKVGGARTVITRAQADFSSDLIPGAWAGGAPVSRTLVSVPITLTASAWVDIDLRITLNTNPGNAYAWVYIFVDGQNVQGRQALNNGVLTMDGSVGNEVLLAEGQHTVEVRVNSALAISTDMRYMTGLLTVKW